MFDIILIWVKEWQFWIALVSLFGLIFSVYKYINSKKLSDSLSEGGCRFISSSSKGFVPI